MVFLKFLSIIALFFCLAFGKHGHIPSYFFTETSPTDVQDVKSMLSSTTKWIVDTDCGLDDVQALVIALKSQLEIISITSTTGNASQHNTTTNSAMVTALLSKTTPVYPGAHNSLLQQFPTPDVDGLGGYQKDYEYLDYKPLIKTLPAALEIIATVKQNPGQVGILMLGPMTNLALAYKLEPTIADDIKTVFFMGGNYLGIGNTNPNAEFNSAFDPEAVSIVFNSFNNVIGLPWEPVLFNTPTSSQQDYIRNRSTPEGRLIDDLFTVTIDLYGSLILADGSAAALLVDPDAITEVIHYETDVELCGSSRGMTIIDRIATPEKQPNVYMITNFNVPMTLDVMKAAVQ